MLVRLLTFVLTLALLSSSVLAWASAGVTQDVVCCCPDPAECKCHDRDNPPTSDQLKRCVGELRIAAASIAPCAITACIDNDCEQRSATRIRSIAPCRIPEERTIDVEVPPF